MKESVSDESKVSPELTKRKKGGMVALAIFFVVIVTGAVTMVDWTSNFNSDNIPTSMLDDIDDNFPVEIFDELEEVIIEAPKEIIKEVEEVPEPVYENRFEPVVVVEPTEINKVKKIPLTVLDMAKFVSVNPTLTDADTDLLISYVVGKERGFVDLERDLAVEKLMEKYLE